MINLVKDTFNSFKNENVENIALISSMLITERFSNTSHLKDGKYKYFIFHSNIKDNVENYYVFGALLPINIKKETVEKYVKNMLDGILLMTKEADIINKKVILNNKSNKYYHESAQLIIFINGIIIFLPNNITSPTNFI